MLSKRAVVCIIENSFHGSPRLTRCTANRCHNSLSYLHHVGAKPLRHVPLGATLTEAAEKWPDRVAVISRKENRSLTFSELLIEADKLAASLRALGMERGDRLGIWMPNCTQWIVSMMAATRAELISVAINHMYGKHEMQYALRKVGVKALVASGSRVNRGYYQVLTEVIPELTASKPGQMDSTSIPELKTVILADDDESSPGTLHYDEVIKAAQTAEVNRISGEVHLINPDSACNIQYTSGTTGDPKAAILSHHGIVNNGYVIGYRNELASGHKKICVQVPLFHVFGLVVTISAAVQHGATMVLPSPTYSPTANLEAMLVEKCDVIHGTPTMHVDLVTAVRSRGVTGVRAGVAVTGGSPVTPQLVQDMASTLNVERVKSIFGMTEGSAVSFQSLYSEDPKRPLHYLGHLHDHLEAKVVDGNNQLVPFGQPGELLIRGYSLMKGYWDDAKKTKECIGEDGWLRSGDQVKLQADGYSQIMGRLKDLIIRGGENIAPKEIEDVMSTHPDVLECQVFGVEDSRLGEDIAAAVRLRDGSDVTPEALSRHVAAKLAKYKVPRIIRQVQAFPKTASGKVQKFKLRNMLESGQL